MNSVIELLGWLREDAEKMAARDLHELMRCWENYHRILTAEAHLRHIQFREETRYPGFYYRSDFPGQDEANWKCFVNSKNDPKAGEWKCFKVARQGPGPREVNQGSSNLARPALTGGPCLIG